MIGYERSKLFVAPSLNGSTFLTIVGATLFFTVARRKSKSIIQNSFSLGSSVCTALINDSRIDLNSFETRPLWACFLLVFVKIEYKKCILECKVIFFRR